MTKKAKVYQLHKGFKAISPDNQVTVSVVTQLYSFGVHIMRTTREGQESRVEMFNKSKVEKANKFILEEMEEYQMLFWRVEDGGFGPKLKALGAFYKIRE